MYTQPDGDSTRALKQLGYPQIDLSGIFENVSDSGNQSAGFPVTETGRTSESGLSRRINENPGPKSTAICAWRRYGKD